ncbi:SusC/RagA family TonB-linked outer membrane protein [Labilibacter marinus]|uniref:SusC/RagA family TonB-linked outer membrane protein n=1 Tax=Labilibacter marinus TaxID=1477105 RepID=UPI000ADF8098|nr:TonB-dependent receptor [Labilibacter marinus]
MANALKRLTMLVLILVIAGFSVVAQNVSLTGSVKDSDGVGIPGVNIVVKGDNTRGTITDFDGNYSISVSSDAVLVYRFIGYETQEIAVAGKTVLNVNLNAETELIDDVVVVGYGTQKKASVVGSITQAKGEELLQAGSVTTVSEALTGILPGVSTMQAAGQPGSTDATILIRGQSSWNNNSPLFIVDGVERDFNDLDPNEIESISVLKDASATAVFGVKAANGVIVVTTKRGNKGKTKVSFSANWGIKSPVIETDYVRPYHEALGYYNQALTNDGQYGNLKPQSEIDAWADPNRDRDFYSYTNWANDLIEQGETRSYNLNISGGNDFVKYFTSFGYNYDGDMFDIDKQEHFDPRTSQKRYNWRSNLDFNFSKTTKVKVNLSGNFKDWHGNRVSNDGSGNGVADQGGSSLARLYSWMQVGAPPVLSNGELGVDPEIATDWFKFNYLGELEREGEISKKTTTINTDIILEQRFLKDFLLKGKMSHGFNRMYKSSITADPLYYEANHESMELLQFGSDPDMVEGLLKYNEQEIDKYASNLYYEGSLLYQKELGAHNISALALWSRRKARSKVSFPSFEESWVGRATYGYQNKYLAEFNGAYNGSEKFAPGKRFGFFPSLAVGWVVSEESFIKDNLSFMDFFKIRYSWGEIGSDKGADRFTYISTYTSRSDGNAENNSLGGYGTTFTEVGDVNKTIYMEGAPANPDATWETAVKQNLGFELGFLNNRIKANIDLFNESRTGILMKRNAIPNYFGNTNPDANIGETKNHGIDMELIFRGNIGNNLQYRFTGNLSLSENRVVNRDDLIYTPDYQKNAGKPIGWKPGYINNGIMQNWNDVYNYTQAEGTDVMPGDFIYTDFNGDGLLNTKSDMVPIGNPSYASKTYAFSINLAYKNFSVNAMFNGMFGLDKELSPSYLWEYETSGGYGFRMLNTEMLDYWTPENTGASHPTLHATNNKYNSINSSYSYRSSDFLRFKSLEVKYRFGKKALGWQTLLDGFELYLNGNNLYTWQKLPKQFDPEAKKLEVYPIAKRYNLGLRATF